jgi:hypothetical protein
MATLEMVPLRSMLPFAGRVTLRHAVPTITPVGALDLQVHGAPAPETTTAPKVAVRPEDGETAARKGGEAR